MSMRDIAGNTSRVNGFGDVPRQSSRSGRTAARVTDPAQIDLEDAIAAARADAEADADLAELMSQVDGDGVAVRAVAADGEADTPEAPAAPKTVNLLPQMLALVEAGYAVTTATTRDVVVDKMLPIKGEDGKAWQRSTHEAKTAIGEWGDAAVDADWTHRQYSKAVGRVRRAATAYGVEQDASCIGGAIVTGASGVTVLDVDCGKVPDPNDSTQLVDCDAAHDMLLTGVLRVAGIEDAQLEEWFAWFASLPHVRTPSGGYHYYFRRLEGQQPLSPVGLIRYVDVRGGYPDDSGKIVHGGLAYMPGNVTAKGTYCVWQRDAGGELTELPTLPAVTELPELPVPLAQLFSTQMRDVHRIARELGVAVGGTGAKAASKRAPSTTPSTNDKPKSRRTNTLGGRRRSTWFDDIKSLISASERNES